MKTLQTLICAARAWLTTATAADKPNVFYILADDMGFGDVKALNPEGKIATPHLDTVVEKGMHFTDAHTSSSV